MAPSGRKSPRPRAVPSAAPRAPRREGERTTLRVPADLAETLARYAEQHRTSPNDALVRLALDGAERYERQREIAELAAIRRAAIETLPEIPPETEMLSGEETARAILGFRLGLYDEEELGA